MKHRGIILFIVLSILVFAGLTVYGDGPKLFETLTLFPPIYWLAALALAFTNYILRLLRWNYYLRVLGAKVDAKTSALVFFAGLGMTISPGRVGELTKSYFLKQKADVPVSHTAPIVITERIADLISVLMLGLWGLILIPFGWVVILLVAASLVGFLLFLSTDRGIAILVRLPVFRQWKPFIEASGGSFRKLIAPRVMAVALLLGVLAWFAEGFAFWLVLRGLGSGGQLPSAVSIYSTSSLLGAVTMLPGGLVTTEGSMLALLQQVGLTNTIASTATFIIRICTLWFAVALGLLATLYLQRHNPMKQKETSAAISSPPSGEITSGDEV